MAIDFEVVYLGFGWYNWTSCRPCTLLIPTCQNFGQQQDESELSGFPPRKTNMEPENGGPLEEEIPNLETIIFRWTMFVFGGGGICCNMEVFGYHVKQTQQKSIWTNIQPPETNSKFAPENGWVGIPVSFFGMAYFQGEVINSTWSLCPSKIAMGNMNVCPVSSGKYHGYNIKRSKNPR